jgi:hypothetical protein
MWFCRFANPSPLPRSPPLARTPPTIRPISLSLTRFGHLRGSAPRTTPQLDQPVCFTFSVSLRLWASSLMRFALCYLLFFNIGGWFNWLIFIVSSLKQWLLNMWLLLNIEGKPVEDVELLKYWIIWMVECRVGLTGYTIISRVQVTRLLIGSRVTTRLIIGLGSR